MLDQIYPQVYTINATVSDNVFDSEDTIGTIEELLGFNRAGVPVYIIVNVSNSEIFSKLIFRMYQIDSEYSHFSISNYALKFDQNGNFDSSEYWGR